MSSSSWSSRGTVAAVLGLAVAAGARAAEPAQQNADVQSELQTLKAKIADLEKKEDEGWISQQRTEQIRSIVTDVLKDAKSRGQFLDSDLQAGYNNGFFIQTADKNFKLALNGYVQFRWTYANADVKHAAVFPAASRPNDGDATGFDFRRARVIFSGNAFTPNFTYLLSGDFAGDSSNSNNFQLLDVWGAYKFTPWLNVRAGSFLLPFTHQEYISSGQSLVDFPDVVNPFDPVRGDGVSVFGNILPDKLTYEVNVSDGSKSNNSGRIVEVGTGKLDNRYAFYTREQFVGSGKLADFNDDADIQYHDNFVWLLGVAGGYESQNSTANAYPSPQTSATVPGLSTNPSPGFAPTYTLNGDLYRGTIDFSSKFRGLSFDAAGFFQEINDRRPAGAASDTFTTRYGRSSLAQFGGYGQVGWVFFPGTKQGKGAWEVVGRFSDLITEGQPNQEQEYTLGLNYYIYGQNLKVQGDVSYIPNEAAFTSSTYSTVQNTQDIVGRVQLQFKF